MIQANDFNTTVASKPIVILKQFKFQPLEKGHALAILNWHYPPPYDCYNFAPDAVKEDLGYLLNPDNAFYAILNSQTELEGFCSFGLDGRVSGGNYEVDALDIGMGIRPDLTGQGQGVKYARAAIDYGIERYRAPRLRVTIARFNQRAQRVWQKLAFELIEAFAKIESGEPFVIMMRGL